MAEVLLSPGIAITETDKSFVPARPLVAGAAIIGPTAAGPAYSPKVVTSYAEFKRTFGDTFMMNRYVEDYDTVAASASAAAQQEYTANEEAKAAKETAQALIDAAGQLYIQKANEPEEEGGEITYSYVEYTGEEEEAPTEFYVKNENDEYVLSEVTPDTIAAANAEIKDLGEDEEAYAESQVSAATKLQAKKQEYLTSMAAKSYFEQGGDSLLVVRVTDNEFKSGIAKVPAINGKPAFTINTISQGEYLNNWDSEEYQDRTETSASQSGIIREDGSLISGSKDNIRWEIANVDPDTGTFSLYVRRGDDLDADKNILEAFSNLSLDPDSDNYIARRIGDQHQVIEEDVLDDQTVHYVTVIGNYPNISKYIYISDVNDIYGYFLADGFTRQNEGLDDDVANELPQQLEGGFRGATGALFSSEEDEAKAVFFEDIKVNSGAEKIQGIAPENYDRAIAILENQDEYQFNVISMPGLVGHQSQVSQMVGLATKRGDCIAVVDLIEFGAKVAEVQTAATKINSNYAAAYWPWLQMYSATGRLEWVPASVVIPGIYAFTDHIAAPWFAPAGMTRGSVQGVIQTERKLLKQHRDELYKKNVNPISILPGNGITIYGQKTLQKKATALDRVNVRRLMIELKNTIKNMASGILFEQNTAALRNAFKGNLDNYLEGVVQRRGLYAYKTVVEEINTPDVIDRNEFRCQIYVQPTKVIEFIYIDFTITNTGVEFNS